jgi:hypothetical protein
VSKIVTLAVFILLLAAILLYFLVFTGVINVISTRPPKATVEIDGTVVGSTPWKQRIRTGVHQITVYKEGFETWQSEEKVSGRSPSMISVKLRFLLRSEPAGARVIMDGENIGVTDLAANLDPGMHTFEYKKSGYQAAKFKANIPLDANEPIPVVSLKPAKASPPEERWTEEGVAASGYGTIQVASTPDAQVYLDGEWQGETPLTIKNVPLGSYVITLSKEGYRDLRKTVYVKKDETAKIAGELKPESSE